MFTKLTVKRKIQKQTFEFFILRGTGFLMIPPRILYNDFIDQPKLTEQKNDLSI